MSKSGVYRIRNIINNYKYIGRAEDIEERWKAHIRNLNKNSHRNQFLNEEWNEYGAGAFEFSVIEYCDEVEYKFRELYHIYNNSNLYNTPSIKDEIVYSICNHLGKSRVDFEIDYKTPECIGTKNPVNWNVHVVHNGIEIFITLRNMDLTNTEDGAAKYEMSMKNKKAFINSNLDHHLIAVEYDYESDVYELCKDVVMQIDQIIKFENS